MGIMLGLAVVALWLIFFILREINSNLVQGINGFTRDRRIIIEILQKIKNK